MIADLDDPTVAKIMLALSCLMLGMALHAGDWLAICAAVALVVYTWRRVPARARAEPCPAMHYVQSQPISHVRVEETPEGVIVARGGFCAPMGMPLYTFPEGPFPYDWQDEDDDELRLDVLTWQAGMADARPGEDVLLSKLRADAARRITYDVATFDGRQS